MVTCRGAGGWGPDEMKGRGSAEGGPLTSPVSGERCGSQLADWLAPGRRSGRCLLAARCLPCCLLLHESSDAAGLQEGHDGHGQDHGHCYGTYILRSAGKPG